MADHADGLLDACERLKEERTTATGTQAYPVQAVILASLAAEIGMKALICRRTGASSVRELAAHLDRGASGHDLEMLFSKLTADEQRAVRLRMVDHLDAGPIQHLYVETSQDGEFLPEGEQVELDLKLLPFDQEIRRARLCFEHWRYSYEAETRYVNASFVEALARAVVDQFTPPPGGTP
jgi:hypothetical protein